jgi:WS/DGAT/MGAT family acyltransferase
MGREPDDVALEAAMSRTKMSNADAAWLHMDRPTNLMIITSAMWFDEPVDWDRMQAVVTERMLDRYPRFRQRPEESGVHLGDLHVGRLHWVDDHDFDIDRHLIRHTLPAPGGDAELQDYVSAVMGQPLPYDRPLWEIHLVDGFKGGSATVTRIHHSVADGISLARVLLSLTDELADAAGVSDEEVEHPGLVEQFVAGARGLASEALTAATDPAELKRLVELGYSGAKALGKLLFVPPDHRTVLKGRMGVHKYARWATTCSLADVKRAGRAHGATVNDVLVSCTAGALHRYLEHRDSLVDDVRAFVPFNLRPLDQPVPTSLGNEFGLVFLDLPVGRSDPVARLAETKKRMDAIKDSPEGPVSYGVLSVIGMTPVQMEKYIVDVFGLKGSLVLTNVPGPREPVSLAGTRVAGVLPWVPQSGAVSMGVSIFSYAGNVTVGINVDARLVPDPDVLLAGFDRELTALGG